jgi:ribosomal protein S18 acetylase RimI-like enzyme
MTIVRDAEAEDARAIGALHVRTWRESYWGVLPDATVLRETVEGRAGFWRTHLHRLALNPELRDESVVVAQGARGALVGFAWCGEARSPHTEWDGEIFMLYVLHAAQRRGVGRLLMTKAAANLIRRGFFRVGLWVLEDNGPARAFYEAMGGRPTGANRRHGPAGAETVTGYAWDDAGVLLGAGSG